MSSAGKPPGVTVSPGKEGKVFDIADTFNPNYKHINFVLMKKLFKGCALFQLMFPVYVCLSVVTKPRHEVKMCSQSPKSTGMKEGPILPQPTISSKLSS